ncbi:hypothetical protein ACH4U7_33600 [Streptomyces sp. NPDC020845]|uniref:hypothetical protein n=1 Tax=Streptomyces sp. NPDC020845 TaxID=3365096 RepID=UPI0037ABF85A
MRFKRVSAAAAVAALSVGALASGASPAGATAGDGATVTACYDTQTFFSKPKGGYTYPYSSSELRTSSACNDINIKLDVGAEVRVCFRSTGCQDQFTWAARGKWTAIATNVKDNVEYNFQFTNEFDQSGYIAD